MTAALPFLILGGLAYGGLHHGETQANSLTEGQSIYTTVNPFNGRNSDIQLWKSSLNGGVLWTQTYDAGRNEYAHALVKDTKGNLYLVGTVSEGSRSDLLILSYSPQGALRWVQSYHLNPDESLTVAATDKEDNLYAAGSVRLGSRYALWIAKYNTWGNRLWDRTFESGYNNYPRNLYVAPLGDLVLTYEEAREEAAGQFFMTKTITHDPSGRRIQ